MATLSIACTIHAPTALVFKTAADPTHFAQAISGVTKIEFLSLTKCGLGTRFRQSRVLNGKEMTLDFDVTDYAENERVRIVNEIHGTRLGFGDHAHSFERVHGTHDAHGYDNAPVGSAADNAANAAPVH